VRSSRGNAPPIQLVHTYPTRLGIRRTGGPSGRRGAGTRIGVGIPDNIAVHTTSFNFKGASSGPRRENTLVQISRAGVPSGVGVARGVPVDNLTTPNIICRVDESVGKFYFLIASDGIDGCRERVATRLDGVAKEGLHGG
jgi:hypothetical protein